MDAILGHDETQDAMVVLRVSSGNAGIFDVRPTDKPRHLTHVSMRSCRNRLYNLMHMWYAAF